MRGFVICATLGLSAGLLGGASQVVAQTTDQKAAPAPQQIPLEHFTKFDEFGTIKISPNGESVALTAGKRGRSGLVFMDLKDGKVTGGLRTFDRFEIADFDWISSTRVVYSLVEHKPGVTTPSSTGELFAIDRDSKNQRMIYGFRGGGREIGTRLQRDKAEYASGFVISPLLRDGKQVLIAEYDWVEGASYWYFSADAKPTITLLDTQDGDKKRVGQVPLSQAELLVDRDDQVRFAVGYNAATELTVLWKPTLKDSWKEFSLPGFDDETIKPRAFSPDNESVYFTSEAQGEKFTALYSLTLKTQKVEKVFGFPDQDVRDVILDLSGRELVGVVGYKGKAQFHWLNENDPAAKLYRALFAAFPNQNVSITSTSQDGQLAIVFVASDVNPGDYYLFNTKTMRAQYLKAARSWIDPEQMRPVESFAIKARDGLELQGYLTRPAGKGPFPMVVVPHGGPHGVRDYWEFDSEVQMLANRGYAVLQLNFRGSGGFGKPFMTAGYREWGAKMQDDITDATRWAFEQKVSEPGRTCIYGASYGGYAALMGAVREPDLYRCAIGYAGVYDLELMFSSADIPRSKFGRSYLDDVLGNNVQDLRARSPAYQAEKIKIPVLLIHGNKDWRVDIEQAKRMKDALEAKKRSVEWMPLNREGHGAYDEGIRLEVSQRVLAFLDKHLK